MASVGGRGAGTALQAGMGYNARRSDPVQSQSELEQIWRQQLLALARDAEAGRPVWRRPEVIAAGLPVHADTGQPFTGIEVLVLWDAAPTERAWTLAEAGPGPVVTRWTRKGRVFCRAICSPRASNVQPVHLYDSDARREQMLTLLRGARDRLTHQGALVATVPPETLDIGLGLALAAAHVAPSPGLPQSGTGLTHPEQLVAAAELGQLLAWATEDLPEITNGESSQRLAAHPALVTLLPRDIFAPDTRRFGAPSLPPGLLDARPGRLAPRLLPVWRAVKRQSTNGPTGLLLAALTLEAALIAPTLLAALGGRASGRIVDDWHTIGKQTRALLLTRPDAEAPSWQALAHASHAEGDPRPDQRVARLARRHKRASWIHLRSVLRIEDLLRDPWWSRSALAREAAILRATAPRKERPSEARLIEVELRDLADAIETYRPALKPEEVLRRALATQLNPEDPEASWEQIGRLAREQDYARRPLCRSGGKTRWLDVPSPRLAGAQRVLHELLLTVVPRYGSAAAFLPGRGIAWHALTHAGSRAAVVVDVRDFFGSVRPQSLAPWLAPHRVESPELRLFDDPGGPWPLLEDYSTEAQDTILDMLFVQREALDPYLAQGAPSSPLAAHLAACRMDSLIVSRAHKVFGAGGFRYSRYADDLVLSAPDGRTASGFIDDAIPLLEGAVLAQGWRPHPTKTRHWIGGRAPLVLCGLEVPQDEHQPLRLAPQLAHRARAAEHRLRTRACYREGGPDLRQAVGLLAHAYAATGDARLLAWISPAISDLAEAIAGPMLAESFLAGWAAT